MLRFIGTIFVLLLQANSPCANSADVAATVTVAPRVEALTATAISLGASNIYPGQSSVTVLAFSVHNTYAEGKSLTSLTVHDASRGAGTPAELLLNLDTLFLFKDSDSDSLLSLSDSLVASEAWESADIALTFGAIDIGSDSMVTFLLAADAAMFPHDGDTVDLFLRPLSDIGSSDGTPVIGSDSLNSLGFGVIDGMVAAQLSTPSTGLTSIGTGDTVYNVFTADIPRNGYMSDTLKSFTIHNSGSAEDTDLEFMVLFSDNGNGIWGGFAEENMIAPLEYTGGHWAASDLDVPLTTPTTRFYLGAKTLPYPVDGATLVLDIPEYGILVASRNDGPLDTGTAPVDTIEIQSEEGVLITSVPLSSGSLIPGEISAPVFSFEFRNGSRDAVFLDSLILQLDLNDPAGGASVADLESQIDSLMLFVDGDGDLTSIDPADLLVATAPAADGSCLFLIGGIQVDASGSSVGLCVALATSLDFARNANTANLSLDSDTDIFVSPGTTIFGSFPLADAPTFIVDAFPAAKVTINSLTSMNLYGGQTNIPILDFVAPGNGYAADTLTRLVVENIGNIDDDVALEEMNLWSDRLGDGLTGDDILVASLTRGTVTWSAANFSQAVPINGQRMLLTVNVSNDQFEGGTLALSIPQGGMTYASDMVGPDDEEIADESMHLIVPPQRITVVSVPTVSTTVHPGWAKNTILTFALYDGYINEAKTLQSIRFENISRSASDDGFSDHEIGQLRLYYDSDANRVLDGDPLIGSGHFQNGVLMLSGLDLSLPPESLAYFFLQSDVATDAIDSDSLGVSINGVADLGFQEEVSINGDLPLTSGGWNIVDGSVKCQYEVLTWASQSVTPGDVLVPLMAFLPASNGDQIDTLVSVTVTNLGTADTADIANLKLWLDSNGDDVWQVTDAVVGSFAYTGSNWGTGGFALAVPPVAPTLFVTGDIQIGGTDGRTVNLSIPIVGCLYTSGNDGPIDSTLVSGGQFTLTGSNLRIARRPTSGNYSIGETIEVEFSATNLSSLVMDSVTGTSSLIGAPTSVRLDSVRLGPVQLAPLDSAEFATYYTAMEPGTVSWSLQAVELATDDSSSILITQPEQIQTVPTCVDLDFVSSMPATVTLGQKNVIPMSLSFAHGDTGTTAASVVLDSISVQIYDSDGNGLAANDVFARARLISNEMNTAEPLEITALQEITFIFDPPIGIESGQDKSLSAVVDIDSLATATSFVMAISDTSSIIFRDNNSGAEVSVSIASGFPLITTASHIDHPPDQLLVAALDQEDRSVNLGQTDARLLRLTLRHPGTTGTAPIQCTELSIEMQDDASGPMIFSDVFDELKVIHRGNVSTMLTAASLNSDRVTLALSSPPILGPGETDTLDLVVDLRSSAALKQFRLVVVDSSQIIARNFSTGENIPVSVDASLMPPGATFPLYSGWIQMQYAAQSPFACLNSTPNASVLAGADNISLMSIVLTYPVTEDFSPLRLRDVSTILLDTTDRALDPRSLFDRLGYILNDSAVWYQASVDPVNGQTVFEFGDEGILIGPSDTVTVQLVADIDAGVPYDHFMLRVGSLEALRLFDATDSSQYPEVVLEAACECSIPYIAGPINLLWPAGRPTLSYDSAPLALAAAGQKDVQIFDAALEYNSLIPRGDIILESLAGNFHRRTRDGLVATSGSAIFESVTLKIDEEVWANDSSLVASTTMLWSNSGYRLELGNSSRFQLEVDIRADAPPGNYVLSFSDSTFIVFVDENVDSSLYPILANGSYPLLSTELSVSAADLKGSLTNYPNPFIPSRNEGVTTFGYFLPEDATLSIDLYTSTGELVKSVVSSIRKAAGTHDEDTWDGRNDRGLAVAPGTYLCVVTAEYGSGRRESVRRKVTIVR